MRSANSILNTKKRFSQKALVSAMTAILLGSSSVAMAFKPENPSHGHRKITEDTLQSFKMKLSDGQEIGFSNKAVSDIYEGNKSTDYLTQFNTHRLSDGKDLHLKGEFNDDVPHCDNEKILECHKRIITIKKDVLTLLRKYLTDKSERTQVSAWLLLGKAIHTIQDFYAHSDFVNRNGNSGKFFSDLTNSIITDSLISKSIAKLSEHDKKVDACESQTPKQGYAGFNGNLTGNITGYTTGYFLMILGVPVASASDKTPIKCDHGVLLTDGIAKDDPLSPFHNAAAKAAAMNTQRIIDELIEEIRNTESNVSIQDNMIAALLGQAVPSKKPPTGEETKGDKPVYGFVIDTTGSMGNVIEGIKSSIQTKIDELAGKAGADQQFMLVTYNDEQNGDTSGGYAGVSDAIFGKAEFIKQKISELRVGGGGDCAENTLRASAKAAVSAPNGSTLLVYTDASANDEDYFQQLTGLTKRKEIALSFGVSGTCNSAALGAKSARTISGQEKTIHFTAKSKNTLNNKGAKAAATSFSYKVDDIYINLAKATGGQVIQTEHDADSAAAALTGIDLSVALGDLKTIKLEEGQISTAKTVSFTLDDQATVMNVIATLDNGDISFTSPSGVVVAGDKLKLFDFLGGQSLKAIDPTMGVWKVTFTPSTTNANYSLKAQANARAELKSVKFTGAEEIGRVGHTYYPNFGLTPIVGKNRIELEIANVTTTGLTVKAVDDKGVIIGQSALSNIGGAFYEAQLTLPETSFRLVVEGKNNAATPLAFERTFSTPVTTDALITSRVWSDPMLAGRKNKVVYRVTNLGEKDIYTITAASDTGHISNLSESSITLEKNQTKDVSFNVEFSSAESTGKESLITTIDVKGTKNQDSEQLIVDIVKDSDGDGVPDSTEMGQVGSDDKYDGNGDGTPDWRQNSVASLYSATLNTYVNIVAKEGAYFTSVKAQPAQATGDVVLPIDAFEIKLNISSVKAAKADIEFILPDFVQAKDFFYRSSENGVWSAFTRDAGIGLKQTQENTIIITVGDGFTGDVDNAKNGEILFYGAPAKIGFKGVKFVDTDVKANNASNTPTWIDALNSLTTSEDKSKGGGCTVGGVGFSDASLSLLLLGGLIMRMTSRRKKQI